ncbi:formimidoylglutamate deiminase [Fodinicurvata sediminis]|uniref:formimidoylglutamate deiminase n=1 Tax=Fodinicurvata sediminis TaxID=1121832 RepID=UPI0003B39662|nr:formimidoylglutamate deiminase [Fodinicurvata sediminis]
MQTIQARQALLPDGWREAVEIDIGTDGRIAAVRSGCNLPDPVTDCLLPAPGNLHSHSFQRALAGLTEQRGPGGQDSFWTWRQLMYAFLEKLTPDDLEAIAALAFMEMLEAGYGAVAEFHYLHHQPDGQPYAKLGETSHRIQAAAQESGLGLTHLPVLYSRGGLDNQPLQGGQKRFGNDLTRHARLLEDAEASLASLPDDARLGLALHSLRAVAPENLSEAVALRTQGPLHIHIAEQMAEVTAVKQAYGARPIDWLLDNCQVDERWCLVHATHMSTQETQRLAHTRAVAGLCPITESNLGDGIFEGPAFIEQDGRFGIGTDSNVCITLPEELRTLEYSQRLKQQGRVVLADDQRSAGRFLYDGMLAGGAQALGRDSGALKVGKLADILSLDGNSLPLAGARGDEMLDAWIFAANSPIVKDVWSAGRHMVEGGRHRNRDVIEARYRKVLGRLRNSL